MGVDGPLLLVNYQQSTIDYELLMVKCQVLVDLNFQDLMIQILTLWVLIVYYCWSTLNSPQLIMNYLWSSVGGFGLSRLGGPNLEVVGVDGPLLLVNYQQSTVDNQLLIVRC